jgi:ABC-type spermidine/putrescine transport system permease subunit II
MAGGRVSRLLLAPLALACLVAGLVPLGVAAFAAEQGIAAGLHDPVSAPVLRASILLAAAACLPGAALGLAGACCLRGAGAWWRALPACVLACAIAVLVLPASALVAWPAWPPPALRDLEGFGSAMVRGAALMMLVATPALSRLEPGLRAAAEAAGARPFQAWRHAVLAPVWGPVMLGVCLGFAAALTQTEAAAILAPHLDLAEAWALPAALLLVACSALGLGALVRVGVEGRG